MLKFLRRFSKDTCGATAIEYGLIVALITLAAVLGMQAVGLSLSNFYTNLSAQMDEVTEE
jgi:pilus assembly protein Flp/PilA